MSRYCNYLLNLKDPDPNDDEDGDEKDKKKIGKKNQHENETSAKRLFGSMSRQSKTRKFRPPPSLFRRFAIKLWRFQKSRVGGFPSVI